MAALAADPVRQFEHSHAKLTALAAEILKRLQAEQRRGHARVVARKQLVTLLGLLRDELLLHFANEEEGLFPFLRQHVPDKVDAVDALESAHDTVSGAVVRLAYLASQHGASRAGGSTLMDYFARFEAAYAAHSRDEGLLFNDLRGRLGVRQRAELAEILRGL